MIMLGDRILVDVGMRMLTPRELYRAQGFGDDYQISIEAPNKRGQMRPLPKDAQTCEEYARQLSEPDAPGMRRSTTAYSGGSACASAMPASTPCATRTV